MDSPHELILLIAIGVGLMLMLAMAFIIFFSFSQNKFRQEQLKVQQTKLEYQERLLHSILQTQEEERSRIAKDLHDEVGSKLNVIHLYLHQLSRKAPDAKNTVSEIGDVLNDAIQTSRRISHDLLPPTLEKFGLASAIEEITERFEHTDALKMTVKTEGQKSQQMTQMVEVNLFRILQELINNTLKYAEATEIGVQLIQNEERISMLYTDNGRGFDITAPENQKGLGMKNIASRLKMIGATYELKSAIGEGIEMRIEVISDVNS